MKESELRDLARVDDTTRKIATDAARSARMFAGIDKALVPSISKAFFDLPSTKLVDAAGIASAARAADFARPIVAPQIADALAGAAMPASVVTSFKEAMIGVDTASAFKVADALKRLDLGPKIPPEFFNAVKMLNLPKLPADVTELLRASAPPDLESRLASTATEAVALAEVDHVAEAVDHAIEGLQGIPPARRRMLALDVALLIAALLIFAAWLSGAGIAEDPQAAAEAVGTDLEGAATAIACAAALVRVYWRLAGKLD